MNTAQKDRRSLSLLLSLLLFLILSPLLEGHQLGELTLIFSLYILLVASIVELFIPGGGIRPIGDYPYTAGYVPLLQPGYPDDVGLW